MNTGCNLYIREKNVYNEAVKNENKGRNFLVSYEQYLFITHFYKNIEISAALPLCNLSNINFKSSKLFSVATKNL